MKVVFAPDSFKGSLSAPDAAHAMMEGWRRVFPDADCVSLPIADGGEGTAAALVASTDGRFIVETVTGPLGKPVTARWALLGGDSQTAVVEMAEAAGLTLVPAEQRDPKLTTTRGVGELLQKASKHPGIQRLIVTLGGSATNDGGAGLLQALGVRLLDAEGRDLPPGGAALSHLAHIDARDVRDLNHRPLQWEIACDVDNPLAGPRGASAVFGPQKGATPEDVALLDTALTHYGTILGRGIADTPGSGAAGGTAAGLLWLIPNARLRPGIDIVLDAAGFEKHLTGADLVLTGEGSLDAQTLGGKAIAGVARRARAVGVPVAALVGRIAPEVNPTLLAEKVGVDAVLPIAPGPATVEESMRNAALWIADAAERAARWMRLGGRIR